MNFWNQYLKEFRHIVMELEFLEEQRPEFRLGT